MGRERNIYNGYIKMKIETIIIILMCLIGGCLIGLIATIKSLSTMPQKTKNFWIGVVGIAMCIDIWQLIKMFCS
jgi:hypothetical protein